MRLEQVLNWVEANKPETILEVGTWNGQMALAMLKRGAKKYIGFDVWEEGSEELDEFENNAKKRATEESVANVLEGKDFELIKGNSRETVKDYVKGREPFVDMAFIDGGHSKATIKSDLINVLTIMKDTGVVFLDDYYFGCPTPDMGAQAVMAELAIPYTVLPKVDKSRDGSMIKVARIDMKDVPRMDKWNMDGKQTWSFTP